MVLTQSWWGLMARNCGGQHQRRPRLSLMGLAASTILIRSLSLKPTHWPPYLHETGSGGTARPAPASIWPCGHSHTAQVTLANQRLMQGAPAATPVHCLHIHFSLNAMGRPFSIILFSFSQFELLPFLFLSFHPRCLFGPLWPPPANPPCPPYTHTHTSLIQEMKTECRRKEEEERQVVQALEEEKRGLTSCCATLRADLEEKERQANSQRDRRDAAQDRVKVWTWGQVLSNTHRCTGRPPSSSFLLLLHMVNSLIPHSLSSSACEHGNTSLLQSTQFKYSWIIFKGSRILFNM